jgi:hypothetical protein
MGVQGSFSRAEGALLQDDNLEGDRRLERVDRPDPMSRKRKRDMGHPLGW